MANRAVAEEFQSTRPVRGATSISHMASSMATFQSTRPVRGATYLFSRSRSFSRFQSTRPVRGATKDRGQPAGFGGISIHAPRAGRDLMKIRLFLIVRKFQSTRPVRGATYIYGLAYAPTPENFNPRAPCGARLKLTNTLFRSGKFQSTRPVRGATPSTSPKCFLGLFQSTRPVRGATRTVNIAIDLQNYFNPRAPCGARRWTGDGGKNDL